MSAANVKSEWVDGKLVFQTLAGATILTIDGVTGTATVEDLAFDEASIATFEVTGTATFKDAVVNDSLNLVSAVIKANGTQAGVVAAVADAAGATPTDVEYNAFVARFNAVLTALKNIGVIASA